MKNQYFGDINDYRKYGLLRVIIRISNLRLLVAWMLTPDDGGTDGKLTSYLNKTGKWSRYDSVLFGKIKDLISHGQERSVGLIEKTDLLQSAKYFSLFDEKAFPDYTTTLPPLGGGRRKKDFRTGKGLREKAKAKIPGQWPGSPQRRGCMSRLFALPDPRGSG